MAKTGKGVVLGADHLEQVAYGRQIAPGHGHNTRGIESLGARNSARESLPPPPQPSGSRFDTNIPKPRTSHVKSNTVRREHFPTGLSPDSLSHAESARPSTPTMEENINRDVRDMKDMPASIKRQMPHKSDTSKAQEIGREDPNYGLGEHFDRGVMDR